MSVEQLPLLELAKVTGTTLTYYWGFAPTTTSWSRSNLEQIGMLMEVLLLVTIWCLHRGMTQILLLTLHLPAKLYLASRLAHVTVLIAHGLFLVRLAMDPAC